MEGRVTPPRKSFAELLRDAVSTSQTERANALLESFRKTHPEIAKAQVEPIKPGQFRGREIDMKVIDESAHISDAVAYGIAAQRVRTSELYTARQLAEHITKPLTAYSSAELIMELLGRGFAVQKVPEQKP